MIKKKDTSRSPRRNENRDSKSSNRSNGSNLVMGAAVRKTYSRQLNERSQNISSNDMNTSAQPSSRFIPEKI
jgi:hypothetical protein